MNSKKPELCTLNGWTRNCVLTYSLPSPVQHTLNISKFKFEFKTLNSFTPNIFICYISHNMFQPTKSSSDALKLLSTQDTTEDNKHSIVKIYQSPTHAAEKRENCP
jgi:hypothetical protein